MYLGETSWIKIKRWRYFVEWFSWMIENRQVDTLDSEIESSDSICISLYSAEKYRLYALNPLTLRVLYLWEIHQHVEIHDGHRYLHLHITGRHRLSFWCHGGEFRSDELTKQSPSSTSGNFGNTQSCPTLKMLYIAWNRILWKKKKLETVHRHSDHVGWMSWLWDGYQTITSQE